MAFGKKDAQTPLPESGVFASDAASESTEKTLTKRHAFIIATMIMIALLTFAIAVSIIGYSILKYRYIGKGPHEVSATFTVPSGAGLSNIASRLEKDQLIKSDNIFKLFVRLDGGGAALKAGEYAIPAQASMRDIYNILRDGKAILYSLTIPEGLTSKQIHAIVERAPELIGALPEDTPEEGIYLPETYLFPKSQTRTEFLAKMRRAQSETFDRLWTGRDRNIPVSNKQEALILASIVEKETGQTSELGRVAGVFTNRLRRGMRLESDPTIIYGLTGGEKLGRGIRRSEIDRKTDWNTYQIDGLPKTPICNPGEAAIAAVLNPLDTKDIFFVADGTGGHVFAETLAGHNKNVANWRKIERARKRAAQKAKQ